MTKSNTHYKVASIGLLAMFVVMVTPNGMSDSSNSEFSVYGMADLVQHNSNGEEVFSQVVHNQLTDQGEDYIIDQVFDTNIAAESAANRIGAICITDLAAATLADPVALETQTAASVGSGGNTLGTSLHCVTSTAAGSVATDVTSTGVIGPFTFTSDVNLTSGETITGIAICAANGGTAPYADCDTPTTNGIAFAVVDTADVILSNSDSVDITYTFDIISDGT